MKTMNKRTKRLHKLMADHGLSAEQVADMLSRALATVRMWRVGKPRTIPAMALELLEAKIAASRAE